MIFYIAVEDLISYHSQNLNRFANCSIVKRIKKIKNRKDYANNNHIVQHCHDSDNFFITQSRERAINQLF